MSRTQEEKSARPATERAEELIDRFGRGLGVFAASTSQRIQSAATNAREKADQRNHSKTTQGKKPTQAGESSQLPMQKADELVDQMEQRIGHFTALISFQVLKATALIREEAEDMWAEAQSIRRQNRRKLQ